jgi:imidazolonepropionase-like amidohydrolase
MACTAEDTPLTPQKGTLVTAHCFTSQGARNAIEGGIGGIEHGSLIDEDTLRLMAKKGVHLTPTLIIQDVRAGTLSYPPPSNSPLDILHLGSHLQ